jgi:hypothetical protein
MLLSEVLAAEGPAKGVFRNLLHGMGDFTC